MSILILTHLVQIKILLAKRRPKGVRNETVKPRGLLEASTEFGGSGARFASLRNRRGVRGGEDGLIQTRLKLSIVTSGDGKFSLFAGKSAGK